LPASGAQIRKPKNIKARSLKLLQTAKAQGPLSRKPPAKMRFGYARFPSNPTQAGTAKNRQP